MLHPETVAGSTDVTSQTDVTPVPEDSADAYCADSGPEGATDSYGDTCSDWVANDWVCEDTYDDSDFTVMDMCCHCGGGQPDGCVDSGPEGAADSYGDTCSDWAVSSWACTDVFDDSDFTVMDMCCYCGGGNLR
jgi:hypothetical protein